MNILPIGNLISSAVTPSNTAKYTSVIKQQGNFVVVLAECPAFPGDIFILYRKKN